MANLAEKTKRPCRVELNCFYKVGDTCVFWQQVEALLSVLQGKYHRGSNCIVNCIDMFREPCLELDEEERQRGVTDILGLCTPGNNPNGELRNL